MVTAEERMSILKMIQDGKITPQQGVQLLEALEEGEKRSTRNPPPQSGRASAGFQPLISPPTSKGRWFHVMVTDTHTGKARVNVRIPVDLVNAGIKMGARFSPQVEGLNIEELMQHLNSGEVGRVLDIYNDEEGEHVEVFID